jgi:single-stranded DNA-binding protein
MMESNKSEINLVMMSGYVAGKPDYSKSPDNKTILRFIIASPKLRKTNTGGFTTVKQYYTVMAYDKIADMCREQKLAMGMQIMVEGKLDQYIKRDENEEEQTQHVYYHINLRGYRVFHPTQAIYDDSPKKHLAARDEHAIGYNADVADLTIKGKDFNPLAD